MSKFKVGDLVRALDDQTNIKAGEIVSVSAIAAPTRDTEWVMIKGRRNHTSDQSYRADGFEIAHTAPPVDLDAIIAKLERIKALRTELGL